jgi:hypothetical protein
MLVSRETVAGKQDRYRIRRWFSTLAIWAALTSNSLVFAQNDTDPNKITSWLPCSVDFLFTPYTSRSNFVVKIVSNDTPVADLTLQLEAEGLRTGVDPDPSSLVSKTNAEGIAEFLGIPRGKYWVRMDGLLPTSAEINVDPNSTPDQVVIQWPLSLVTARSAKGIVVSEKKSKPLEGVRVQLLSVRTNSSLGDIYTDSKGQYEVHAPSDGFFALRFTPRGESNKHKDIGLEIRQDGVSAQLPALKLENTDCGMLLSFVSGSHKH